jgi:hypothetical protein
LVGDSGITAARLGRFMPMSAFNFSFFDKNALQVLTIPYQHSWKPAANALLDFTYMVLPQRT